MFGYRKRKPLVLVLLVTMVTNSIIFTPFCTLNASSAVNQPTTVSSAVYSVSGNYIRGISASTTVSTFIGKFNESDITLFNGDDEALHSSYVSTGMQLNLYEGNDIMRSFTTIVSGDINGDGKITLTDFVKMKSHILGKDKLSGAQFMSSDLNNDNKVTLTDFVKLKSHILGKSTLSAVPDNSALTKRDFSEYLSINTDVVGFISIPGTVVDYPVLQDDDNMYYINHTIDHKERTRGAIFMDCSCFADELCKNTVLHGHHMADGSMFRFVEKYKEEAVWNANPIIRFDTLSTSMEWEVFSVYVEDGYTYSLDIDFVSPDKLINYCNELQNKSLYNKGLVFNENDYIITLSTCSYEFDNARTLIHARLIKRSN